MPESPKGKGAKDGLPSNCIVMDTLPVKVLMTKVRDKKTPQLEYIKYADRVMRLLVEEGLSHLPSCKPVTVETPCGPYEGLVVDERVCCVSIVRSGNTLLEAVRQVVPDCAVGHVLVQRDESDPEKKPIFFYKKFPPDIAHRQVVLVDPMLATGGSAIASVKCLLEAGVREEMIVFVNLVSAPEGVKALNGIYPKITIVTAQMDPGLNEHKFIVPGLGDFGDRYYNTGDFCNSEWVKSPLLDVPKL